MAVNHGLLGLVGITATSKVIRIKTFSGDVSVYIFGLFYAGITIYQPSWLKKGRGQAGFSQAVGK